MNKNDFINNYCNKSNISSDKLNETQVVLPCKCGDESCEGWAVVSNNPLSIKAHNELYSK